MRNIAELSSIGEGFQPGRGFYKSQLSKIHTVLIYTYTLSTVSNESIYSLKQTNRRERAAVDVYVWLALMLSMSSRKLGE